MRLEIALIPVIAGALVFIVLKLRKRRQYRQLQERQRGIIAQYGAALDLPGVLPDALPDFRQRIAVVAKPLPEPAFDLLRGAALRYRQTERSYFPAHKQGGTIA
ncbi:MAG: hypothetical protein U1F70_06245, partial [Candidatus Competibacteraceae bacterium]